MFTLLDTLAQEGDAMSLKIVSERTGLHPSTAHRILNDLAAGGFVERSGPGTYRLGLRLLHLGNVVRTRLNVLELATRPMQDLHRLSTQVISLYLRHDDDVQCVARTHAERSGVQVIRLSGARSPLYQSAPGKALATRLPARELADLAQQAGISPETLKAELGSVRAQGWAIDGPDVEHSAQTLAAPILNDQGQAVAALGLPGSAWRATPDLSEALRQSAARISVALGWQIDRI